MNKNYSNDFIVPEVRFWTRIAFLAVGGTVVAIVLALQWTTPSNRVDYQAELSPPPKGSVTAFEEDPQPAEVPSLETVLDSSSSEIANNKPTEKTDTDVSEILEVAESRPTAESEANQPSRSLPQAADPKASTVSIPIIKAGETAPGFELVSDSVRSTLLNRMGARLIVTDGVVSVEVCKDAGTPQRLIDASWHNRFAYRMVRMDNSMESRRLVAECRKRFPQLTENASVKLSIMHSTDRAILEAQKQFLGTAWDVSKVTVVDLTREGNWMVVGVR